MSATPDGRRSIALIAAGIAVEDWLDPLGISLEEFAGEMTGGWMFNYVDALAEAGVETAIVCLSRRTRQPTRLRHGPTGAVIWLVPTGRLAPAAERALEGPTLHGARDPMTLLRALRRHAAPYGLTPVRTLLRVLREEGCDALLCQDYDTQRFDATLVLGRRLGVPVFATFQGGPRPFSALERGVRRLALRACAGLVVPAQQEIEDIVERYGTRREKLARIPNPLDTGTWKPVDRAEARSALGLSPDATVAITHGRVHIDDKGLDVLLQGWARLRAQRPDGDLELLIVGSGDDSAAVAGMIAAGDFPGARLVDRFIVDPRVLRQHLSAADVYVFAGRYEGFPVAPTEAMACGLPLVATDASGIPDLLEGGEDAGGVVVPRDDVAAFADALGRLIGDPELRHELGARARRRVEEFCSLESVGRALERFFVSRGMRAQ